MSIVHYATVMGDGTIAPLCGNWGESKSWTRLRIAVTCPRCLERLRTAA